MALANSSRVQLRRIIETVFGTTPVAGNAINLRATGESLDFDIKKESSKELRSDRQISGATPVSAQGMGGVNFHLSYNEYDDLFASAFQGSWAVFGVAGVGATFTGTFTTTTITAGSATAGASIFTDLKPGQWFRLLAPTHANNGLLLRVSTSVAPTTTVITLDTNTPAVAGAGIVNCAIQTSRLTNGATQTSFSLEKEFPDVAQFLLFKGMTPGKLNLKFAAANLTDGSIDFMGQGAARAAVTGLPGTPVVSQVHEIHNAASGVGRTWEAGVPMTGQFIKSLDITLDNVQRAQEAIGNFGLIGVGSGTVKVTGTMDMYFSNGNMYDKFLASTYTSVIVSTQDPSGNGYVLTLPRVQLMKGKVVAGAKDQDVMATFEIEAFSDDANANAALRKTVILDRVGVAATVL
jgi:hypothetical protein